jgi:hypothetical protein
MRGIAYSLWFWFGALALSGNQSALAQESQPIELDVRIVPGTRWSASVTKDRESFVSCQITTVTNDAEVRFTIASKGSLVLLLRDEFQENAIRDTLGWGGSRSYRGSLFIDSRPPITTQVERIWEHSLLIPLSKIDPNVLFRARKIAIAVGGISMRGYDVTGLSVARRDLYDCYKENGNEPSAPPRR